MEIQKNKKLNYCTPLIECVQLDNEISLALESTPPTRPEEGYLKTMPECISVDPFKTHIV